MLFRSFLPRAALLLFTVLRLEGQEGGYVGAEACAKCHGGIHREWAESRHSRMMQAATKQSVQADFGQGRVVLHGSAYVLRQDGGAYYITESDLTGKPWEHRVEYTLGGRRVQHYLTTLPDGRIILIPSAWDVAKKAWVHDVDVGNPEELAGDRILVWNKTCFGCHVSRERKGFDLEHLPLQDNVAEPRRELRELSWSWEGACGSREGRDCESAEAGSATQHDDLRAMPFDSRHLCRRVRGGRELLRSFFAVDGI